MSPEAERVAEALSALERKKPVDAPQEKREKRQRNPSLDPVEFVRKWQESESLEDVVKWSGAKSDFLRSKAAFYRSKGVKLKLFPLGSPGRPPLNWDQLKEIAASYYTPKETP